MDSNPYRQSTNYVDLLTSQHGVFSFVEDSVQLFSLSQVPVFRSQGAEASSCPQDTTAEHREHRMWTPTSHAHETMTEEERPPNVKATKGKKKKNVEGKETLSQFQTMWEIKPKDLVSKDMLSRMRILDRLLAKQLR
ncbi:hypothetical protein Bca4012_050233 [Brassica carinata]|uniref:Uncharacterized protein n=1 Tax=Brassica carinata TaxID=52824 RepID=A0A8X7R4A7_BRACI|nr:hypothetical protein Bca52824_052940 [Brassica carinata]